MIPVEPTRRERIADAIARLQDSGPWCVWMLCPDGRHARIIRFWWRPAAQRFVDAHHKEFRLKVRTAWWKGARG